MKDFDTEGHCCAGMLSAFQNRTLSGHGIWASERVSPGELHFFIGWRPVDKDNADKFSSFLIDLAPDICVSLSSRTGLKFCPWCGKDLKRFYRKKKNLIVDEELTNELKT